MRYAYFLAIGALTTLVGATVAGDPGSSPSASSGLGQSEAVWRPAQAVLCGPNALYLLLKAHDRPVSASAFFREIDPGHQGLSLVDLRDLCARYGLPAEGRRCTYQQLAKECRLPLIALVHPRLDTTSDGDGHYVLVIDADSDGVTLIDGTSGEKEQYPRDAFCRIWKGYALVPAASQVGWRLLLAVSGAECVGLGYLIFGARRRGARLR